MPGHRLNPRHTMLPHEEAIMDLWDANLSEAQIAERLDIPQSRARSVTKTYCDTMADLWAPSARIASMQLADALARVA